MLFLHARTKRRVQAALVLVRMNTQREKPRTVLCGAKKKEKKEKRGGLFTARAREIKGPFLCVLAVSG